MQMKTPRRNETGAHLSFCALADSFSLTSCFSFTASTSALLGGFDFQAARIQYFVFRVAVTRVGRPEGTL
jgi:hypothetical protein